MNPEATMPLPMLMPMPMPMPMPSAPGQPQRRVLWPTVVLLALSLLTACSSTPLPPLQLYRMAVAAPLPVPAAAAGADASVWQLLGPVRLPGYLDRDAVLVPQGEAGLQALPGQRWAEPLHEAVPRLLREDLALLRGRQRLWAAPVPAGVVVQRQLRVELLALEANADRSQVQLRAQWSLADLNGKQPPHVGSAQLSAAVAGSTVDALVAAHRLVLWQLAMAISQTPL